MADEDVILVRDARLVEHADHGVQHAHAGIAMEVAQVVAIEELRDVLGQRPLDVEQVDAHRPVTVDRDCLTGSPSGIAGVANGDDDIVHGVLRAHDSAARSSGAGLSLTSAGCDSACCLRASILPAITTNSAPTIGARFSRKCTCASM